MRILVEAWPGSIFSMLFSCPSHHLFSFKRHSQALSLQLLNLRYLLLNLLTTALDLPAG